MNSTDFIENKYKKWYFSIIENAHGREYDNLLHERHHIIPSSLGGTNDKQNIVPLLFREHFVCHWLLTKFTTSIAHGKMCGALRMMMNKSSSNNRVLTNRHYEIARTALSRTTRTMSEQFKQKQSQNRIGSKNPMFGRTQSETQKQKARDTMKLLRLSSQQEPTKCPHCNLVGGRINMKRYHFNNCKLMGGI